MDLEDIILVTETARDTETNLVLTKAAYQKRYEEKAVKQEELEDYKGTDCWLEGGSHKAKYCSGETDIESFLNGDENRAARFTFKEAESSPECIKALRPQLEHACVIKDGACRVEGRISIKDAENALLDASRLLRAYGITDASCEITGYRRDGRAKVKIYYESEK